MYLIKSPLNISNLCPYNLWFRCRANLTYPFPPVRHKVFPAGILLWPVPVLLLVSPAAEAAAAIIWLGAIRVDFPTTFKVYYKIYNASPCLLRVILYNTLYENFYFKMSYLLGTVKCVYNAIENYSWSQTIRQYRSIVFGRWWRSLREGPIRLGV